jgi:hypothetical protein
MKQQLQQDIFETFGELDMSDRKEFVELNRVVRPTEWDDNIERFVPTAKGGIVFHFYINQLQQTLTYTWAVCHPDDNFSRKLGAKIAKQRFDGLYKSSSQNDLIQTITYDRTIPLTENVVKDLHYRYNTKSGKEWSKELYTMYTTLRNLVY